MSKHKRLGFTTSEFCDMGCECGLEPTPVECKDGRFVFWDDYAELQAENARLKAEIERLYRNGDLMLKFAAANMSYPAYATFAKDWIAVKEGKQS